MIADTYKAKALQFASATIFMFSEFDCILSSSVLMMHVEYQFLLKIICKLLTCAW